MIREKGKLHRDGALNKTLPVLFVLLLSSTYVASSQRSSLQQLADWDFPRLNEIYMIEAYPSDVAMDKVKAGEIDTFVGAIRRDQVEELNASGWNISMNPGFHMCYLGINCRDATPNSSGVYSDYHGRTPGFELYPLNISAFRWALHLLIGDRKEALIKEGFMDPREYEPINVRLDTVVPPANKFWFSQDIPPVPYDPVEAYNVLTAAGFSNDTGYWVCPNGQEMRHMYVIELISLCPPPLIQDCVKIWNSFFGKMSDGMTDYFEWDPIDTITVGLDIIFGNRDFDIYYLGWLLTREPNYLFDLFHPSMDRSMDIEAEWGKQVNIVGLDYPPLNRLLYMLKYGEDPDTHRLITDINEMRQICYDAQWHLYNQTPYIPLYSRNYVNLYKPGLTSWVESSGYGSASHHLELPWTYCSIHWEGTPVGGSINWHVPGNVETFNPGIAKWSYEWTVLNRLYDSLIAVNPYTHEDMPWAALYWTMEPYINETENVPNGMVAKFWLRNDLYWHDGLHVTAQDVKWNWDFIKKMGETGHFTQLREVWSTYIKSKVIHDYLVEVYINTTGLWKVYNYAENALKFPKIIWEPFWNDPEGAEAFKPWDITYQDWTGNPPPADKPYLKCLIGTGPFWLDYWNEIDTAHLIKNVNYWVPPLTATANIQSPFLAPGKWMTVYIESVGHHVYNINVSTLLINETIPVDSAFPPQIGDYNDNGIPDLTVRFNKAAVMSYVLSHVDFRKFKIVKLTVSGKLYDGTPFEASDTVIIAFTPKQLILLY